MLLRRTADRVRDDVRLVDDVGRLSDGRLVVMLPATQAEGARVVARRLAAVIGSSLDTDQDGVGTEVLAVDVDPDALERFACALEESVARVQHPVENAA
jgi:PleD family two-component response regulator